MVLERHREQEEWFEMDVEIDRLKEGLGEYEKALRVQQLKQCAPSRTAIVGLDCRPAATGGTCGAACCPAAEASFIRYPPGPQLILGARTITSRALTL